MVEYKTPGIYIEEVDAFPTSVVQVATDIPVFIGYTKKAAEGAIDLKDTPKLITSFAEYEMYFGGAPKFSIDRDETTGLLTSLTPFLMHRALQLFFLNGGARCYVLSVGSYLDEEGAEQTLDATTMSTSLAVLDNCDGPTMIVVPDAALMSLDDWAQVSKAMLSHCAQTKCRIALLDLVNGDHETGSNFGSDPLKDFHTSMADVEIEERGFGAAYYPWLKTILMSVEDISPDMLSNDLKAEVQKQVEQEIDASQTPDPKLKSFAENLTKDRNEYDVLETHIILLRGSKAYKLAMNDVLGVLNLMPPSAALAGVICAQDNLEGPWRAPANIPIVAASAPAADINTFQQNNLNAPSNGLAVNALRRFAGRPVLVWGARTLNGNSADWRYLSVRRTMIMIEQSIQQACAAYVFEPNTANTWSTIKSMIENFLTGIWKSGGLAGAATSDAFAVHIGLGQTMTAEDILQGRMIVEVHVAVVRPAEFITITVTQQMAPS